MITEESTSDAAVHNQDRYLIDSRGICGKIRLLPRECHGNIRKVCSKRFGSWAMSGTRLGVVRNSMGLSLVRQNQSRSHNSTIVQQQELRKK